MVDPNPDPRADADALARNRWAVITALRLAGVAMVVAGVLTINGVLGLPTAAGYVLLAVGLLDTFLVPHLLARKWRTPRP